MGGNATAIDRETGKPLKQAEKFDIRKVPREIITKNVIDVLNALNNSYQKKYKEPIWKDFEIVKSGKAFNGSSEAFFNKEISDEDFIKHKPMVGDIDITVPAEKLEGIFEVLKGFEKKNITPETKYWGQVKKDIGGSFQINAVFQMQHDKETIYPQIDFEAVKYDKKGDPDEFSKFSHSSTWEDIQSGYKGVMHKYWLQALVAGRHTREDAIIITPASKEWPPEAMKIKKVDKVPSLAAFSIDRGVRVKLRPIMDPKSGEHIKIKDPKSGDMKLVYKEVPTEQSDYITDLDEMFKFIFDRSPTKEERKKMSSLVGLMELSKQYVDKTSITYGLDYVVNRLWGGGAQQLERDDPEADKAIKMSLINLLFKTFPYLQKKKPEIEKAMKEFYKSYKSAEEFMAKKMEKFNKIPSKKESNDFAKFYYLEKV